MERSFIIVWQLLAVCLIFAQGDEFSCPAICLCPTVNRTNCQNNNLDDLPEGIYAKATHLDLSLNNFEALPRNLSLYKYLRWLNVSHNRITTLSNDSLSGLDELRVLDLSGNRFNDWADIGRDAFLPARNLLEMDLSYNPLKGFRDLTEPLRLTNLRTLRLINCSIADVFGDVLEGLPGLEELSLARNEIASIRTEIRSAKLQALDLSHCGLKHVISEALAQLPALKILWLSNNYELKKFTSASSSLEFLDVSDCNIEGVSPARLPALTIANYHGNHIRNLPAYTFFNATKLQVLDLSNNALSKIDPNAFYGLEFLRNVDLSYNTISYLDRYTFRDNFKLIYLNLSHNYFTKIPQFDIESLKYLDLGNCEIRSFGQRSLVKMPNLKELILSRNLLSRLPDGTEAQVLFTLDLGQCHITRINNQTFSEMPRLRNLNLAGNRLTSDLKASYFPQVIDLRLDDNPWHCDCNFDFLAVYEQFPQKHAEPRCQSPENVEGATWVTACSSTWFPTKPKQDKMWWYSLGLLAVMVVMFCVIMSIRRAYQQKEQRLREAEERERAEARERLRRMREQQMEAREAENRNAPDPRELQRPPSYTEALLMSNLTGSFHSLSGSRHSLSANNRQSERGSNQDVSKKGRRRRKRRKEKASSSEEQSSSRRRRSQDRSSSSDSEPARRVALESDF